MPYTDYNSPNTSWNMATLRLLELQDEVRMYAVRIGIHEYCKVKREIMKMEGTYTKILPHLEWSLICRCDREFLWGRELPVEREFCAEGKFSAERRRELTLLLWDCF